MSILPLSTYVSADDALGFVAATATYDWTLFLEICDRASANEQGAKEAARALRREFKYVHLSLAQSVLTLMRRYAEPSSQLSAARLWAIMLRNTTSIFIGMYASNRCNSTS